MEALTEDIYTGPMLSITSNAKGVRVHRLIDDTCPPVRASKLVVRRDPMVAALFGAAGTAAGQPPAARGKASKQLR